MARIRSIKPEFFQDRKMAAVGPIAALVYVALWCLADDGGVAPVDVDRVKGELFYGWASVPASAVADALDALERAGCIRRYRVGGDTYAEIPTFAKHQVINKPSKTRFPRRGRPEPSGRTPEPLPEPSGSPPEKVGMEHGAWSVEHGGEQEPSKALVELRSTATPATARIEEHTNGRRTREAALKLGAQVVFAYWAARLCHPKAVLDRKRETRLTARLRENGGGVTELLYAVDGALRDEFLMGRDPQARRAFDGIETVFRDRGMVERLVETVPNRAERHPFLEQEHVVPA
jgi:hypothetical protein